MIARGTAISDAVAVILRDHAEALFVSQVELSKRTNISQSQISKIFRLESKLTVAHMAAICNALDLSAPAVLAEAERSI